MDPLIQGLLKDTLEYLREADKTTPSVFATKEEIIHFAPRLAQPNHAPDKKSPPPLAASLPKKIASPPKVPVVESPPKITKVESAKVERALSPPQPMVAPTKRNFTEMRQLVEKTLPELVLRDTIPDDAHAKTRARLWQETYLSAHVVVIAFGEVGPGLEFLKNVTTAIDRLIAPAQLIEGSVLEKERGWDLLLQSPSLQRILCSPWSAWQSTALGKHYKQNGATQEQFLGSHRLFLLEPSLVYLKNPDRKQKLWQFISTQLLS